MSSNRIYTFMKKEIAKERAANEEPKLNRSEKAHIAKEASIIHDKYNRLVNLTIHKQQEIHRARAEKQEHTIRFGK